jgi:HK97 gp10 family phage protein
MRTFRIEGLSELLDALQELPKATGTNVLKRALVNASDPMVKEAERLAPHLTGTLQRSIDASPRLSTRAKAKHTKQSKVEIFVGPGSLRAAAFQEFGTVHHRPQPFLRPAWEGTKLKMLDSIGKEIWNEIQKAAARLARKAARSASR